MPETHSGPHWASNGSGITPGVWPGSVLDWGRRRERKKERGGGRCLPAETPLNRGFRPGSNTVYLSGVAPTGDRLRRSRRPVATFRWLFGCFPARPCSDVSTVRRGSNRDEMWTELSAARLVNVALPRAPAWPTFVELFRRDLARDDDRALLEDIVAKLRSERTGSAPSELRAADIAIWMNGGPR
jgi:hypothetical protein